MAGTVCLAQYNTYKATREREKREKRWHTLLFGAISVAQNWRFKALAVLCVHTRVSAPGLVKLKPFLSNKESQVGHQSRARLSQRAENNRVGFGSSGRAHFSSKKSDISNRTNACLVAHKKLFLEMRRKIIQDETKKGGRLPKFTICPLIGAISLGVSSAFPFVFFFPEITFVPCLLCSTCGWSFFFF